MFYKAYQMKYLDEEPVETPFRTAHFKEADLYRPELFTLGMPELEALRLMNKWNSSSGGWRYWV